MKNKPLENLLNTNMVKGVGVVVLGTALGYAAQKYIKNTDEIRRNTAVSSASVIAPPKQLVQPVVPVASAVTVATQTAPENYKTKLLKSALKSLDVKVTVDLSKLTKKDLSGIKAEVSFDFPGFWFDLSKQSQFTPNTVVPVEMPKPLMVEEKPVAVDLSEFTKTRENLLAEAKAFHSEEDWVKNSEKPGFFANAAKSQIKGTVHEKIDESKNDLVTLGLNDGQIKSLEETIANLVFEYYVKNGNDSGNTEKYVQDNLVPNVNGLFAEMRALFLSGNHPYKTPMEMLEAFSTYSEFNFYGKDAFNQQNLRRLAVTKKADLDNLIVGFRKFAAVEKTMAGASGK